MTLIPTNGVVPGFGLVNYVVYAAPVGTPLGLNASGLPDLSLWTAQAVPSVSSLSPGLISPSTVITLTVGTAGANEELAVIAYTGTLTAPTLFGFSGSGFNGGSVTNNGIATSTGALEWSNGTGDLDISPPTQAIAITLGSAGMGSIVLVPVPEPSIVALGGIGAAVALCLRRRR